jgi:LytS/YehU family sensor histidine kinase
MARILLHVSVNVVLFLLVLVYKTGQLGLKMALVNAFINIGGMALIFYSHGKFLVNTYFEAKKYLPFAIGSISFFIIILWIRIKIEIPLFPSFYNQFGADQIHYLYFFIGLITFILLVFSTLVHLLENRFEKEKKAQLLIQEHQAAQLQFLKAQINPHFLFNNLNNIYSLSIVQSPKTPQMILKLSDLLRYVIYESQNKKVSLAGEIRQIEKYIELFQLRNEAPVNIQLEIEGEINNQIIEPMILIPLVENTFKHCDFDSNEQAYVKIQIKVVDNTLHFSTINSKNENNQQKDKVGGVGLINIKKRLSLNYPQQHEIKIDNQEHSFEVNLKIYLTHGKN